MRQIAWDVHRIWKSCPSVCLSNNFSSETTQQILMMLGIAGLCEKLWRHFFGLYWPSITPTLYEDCSHLKYDNLVSRHLEFSSKWEKLIRTYKKIDNFYKVTSNVKLRFKYSYITICSKELRDSIDRVVVMLHTIAPNPLSRCQQIAVLSPLISNALFVQLYMTCTLCV